MGLKACKFCNFVVFNNDIEAVNYAMPYILPWKTVRHMEKWKKNRLFTSSQVKYTLINQYKQKS